MGQESSTMIQQGLVGARDASEILMEQTDRVNCCRCFSDVWVMRTGHVLDHVWLATEVASHKSLAFVRSGFANIAQQVAAYVPTFTREDIIDKPVDNSWFFYFLAYRSGIVQKKSYEL